LILCWLNLKLGDDLRERGHHRQVELVTDEAIAAMAPRIGTRAACAAAGVAQATWYRRHRASPAAPRLAPVPHRDRVQPRALAAAERQAILDMLHSARFADTAPAEVWAVLLDEGIYLGSVSTFYRVLREAGESRERRAQAAHPAAVKPELAATGPNQVYSWDITRLHGPVKWTYYHLYVILDIFSRYAVGWMVATRESAVLAEKLIAATCAKQGIARGQLTIHADRGSSMTSKPVALLLADLGVTQSHSRPHVSNDNPFSESQFKTFKYRPDFPRRFDSIEAARAHCQDFFPWYNNEHRHGGLGLHTAADVHHGRAAAVRAGRALVLTDAYRAHPERFVRRPPAPPKLPVGSWINPPNDNPEDMEADAQ
jgi:putative transposase